MKYIDLHLHSNYSDGTCTPAELIERAVEKNLAAIALTDHDTVAGIDEAIEATAPYKDRLLFIPGTELSVAYKSRDIHVLGLFIDHHDKSFQQASEAIVARRNARNEEMAENLRKAGVPVTMEALTASNPDTVVTRAHFARFMVDHKIVSTPKEAFQKYLDSSTPYYVPRKYIAAEEGIEIIRHAGGIPILAHPLMYHLEQSELERLIQHLKNLGIMGIEVKYSNYSYQDECYVSQLARRFRLLPSGGSDFHGSNKPAIDMGTGKGTLAVPYEYLERLLLLHEKNRNA